MVGSVVVGGCGNARHPLHLNVRLRGPPYSTLSAEAEPGAVPPPSRWLLSRWSTRAPKTLSGGFFLSASSVRAAGHRHGSVAAPIGALVAVTGVAKESALVGRGQVMPDVRRLTTTAVVKESTIVGRRQAMSHVQMRSSTMSSSTTFAVSTRSALKELTLTCSCKLHILIL